MLDRRSLLVRGALTALASGVAPRMAFAKAETDRRFVFIIQRGAADGLGVIAPVGDPAFVRGLQQWRTAANQSNPIQCVEQ